MVLEVRPLETWATLILLSIQAVIFLFANPPLPLPLAGTGKSKGIRNRIPAYILKLVLSGALRENEVEITGRIWNQDYVQELGPQQAELSEPGAKGRNVAPGLTCDARGRSFQGFSFM